LLVDLDDVCGHQPEDAAWLAVALAERSPGHADQVVDVVTRLVDAVEQLRTDRRIGRRVADLAAEHGPASRESRIAEIRDYCLSLPSMALQQIAQELQRLDSEPATILLTPKAVAAYAVSLARRSDEMMLKVASVCDEHHNLRIAEAIGDLKDYAAPADGWEERVLAAAERQERRGWFRRLFDRLFRLLAMLAMLAAALSGCGYSLSAVNGAALGGSLATVACDWGQTRRLAARGWPRDSFEMNPMLGSHPRTTEVDLYFAAYLLTSYAIWKITPKEVRWAASAMIIGVQAEAIVQNHGVARQLGDESICGDQLTDK
jgi:hypothetical protein